jgi:hypothetical protein
MALVGLATAIFVDLVGALAAAAFQYSDVA